MLFQHTCIRWSWVPCLMALASIVSMGEGLAEPPERGSAPGAPIVPVDEELWNIAADELGVYIRQLELHLAWMRKWAAFRHDTDTVTAVEALQKKLSVAKEKHRELCRLCAEQLQDTPSAIACCQKIDDIMHEVIEDHVTLMRQLHARRQRHQK